VRLLGLDKGLWLDEYHSLQIAFAEPFFDALKTVDHPPLYFVLLRHWGFFSHEETFLRLLSVLFGWGTVLVVVAWGRTFSRCTGLVAGLLVATNPILLRYAQEIRGYALLLFATAVAFWATRRWSLLLVHERGCTSEEDQEPLPNGRVNSRYVRIFAWILSGALTVAILSHMVGIFALTSVLLYGILSLGCVRVDHLKRLSWIAVLPVATFLSVYFVLAQTTKNAETWWVPEPTGNYLLRVSKELVGWNDLSWLENVSGSALPVVALFALIVSGLVARRGWKTWGPLAVAALAYPTQLLLVSIFYLPVLASKTLLPVLLPLTVLVSGRTCELKPRLRRTATTVALVLLALIWPWHWYRAGAYRPIEPWKPMAEHLASVWRPCDTVVFVPGFIAELTLYYGAPLNNATRFSINHARHLGPLADYLDRLPHFPPRHLFVVERIGTKPRPYHDELTALLADRARQDRSGRDFGGLRVTRYRVASRTEQMAIETADEIDRAVASGLSAGRTATLFVDGFESGDLTAWSTP
jgi:hypothetical protein